MNKKQDKRIWTRMGRELSALRELMIDIETDPDYQAVMNKVTWGKLLRAQGWIDRLRSESESRMARVLPGCDMHVFYHFDKTAIYTAIDEFRDRVREEGKL